ARPARVPDRRVPVRARYGAPLLPREPARRQLRLAGGKHMATVTADDLYSLVKKWESTFPLPAPYVTVDVGTFDAAAGTFRGLTTQVETDPEPIEHGPHDHPTNPAPRFVGQSWLEVTI